MANVLDGNNFNHMYAELNMCSSYVVSIYPVVESNLIVI